jgi:hypothetical protein
MNASTPLDAYIAGVAFWSPRMPTWDAARACLRSEQVPLETPQPRPATTLLAPAERRRVPDSVAIALEVASQACIAADLLPQKLTTVFASTHGDLAISDYLCATLAATPTHISPTKFHNSVHNAAAGYWSIGTKSHAPYTAISAHKYTFATGLLEAVTQLLCDDRPVLYVAYDIEACGPMATMAPSSGMLATALVLTKVSAQSHSRIALQIRNRPASIVEARSSAADAVRGNAMANALTFFAALAQRQQAVALPLGEELSLHIELAGVAR